MKRVTFIQSEKFHSLGVFRSIMQLARPGVPISPDEMRRRIRVLDFLDEAEKHGLGYVDFEDADCDFLYQQLNTPSWSVADKVLLQIIDAVRDAEPCATSRVSHTDKAKDETEK